MFSNPNMTVGRSCQIHFGPKISDLCDTAQLSSIVSGNADGSESNSVVIKLPTNITIQSAYCYVATVTSGAHKIQIEGSFHTGTN